MNRRSTFSQGQLKPLTSLRFVSASLVLVYHCQPTAALGTTYALGQAGVGFFFLLSGFILTYTYHDRFVGGLTRENVRAFYVARVARIYPMYLVGMVLAVAVLWCFGGQAWDRSDAVTREFAFAAQLSLIQSWIPNENIYFGINAPAWSVSVEALFYALFPFLIGSLLRSFQGRSSRTIAAAAALPWLMLVLIVLVPHRIAVWTAYVIPPVRLVDFIVGIMVGIAFIRTRDIPLPTARTATLEVAAIAAVIGAILISPMVPEALRYGLFLMPFWSFLIWALAWQRGVVSRLLSDPLCVRMGEASFAIYLVHWAVIQAMTHTIGWQHPIPAMALTLVIVLGLSIALHHFVEQPLRVRLHEALSRSQRVRSVPVMEQTL